MTRAKRVSLVVCVSSAAALGSLVATGQQNQGVQPEPQIAPQRTTVQQEQLQRNPYALTRQQSESIRQMLSSSQRREVSNIARDIAAEKSISALRVRWSALTQELAAQGRLTDVDSLVQQVLGESYAMATVDVQEYAERVKMLMEVIARLQEEMKYRLAELRELQAQLQQSRIAGERADIGEKMARLRAEISALQEKLRAAEHDAELANLGLQSKMQSQNRIFTTISNVMKMFHDIARSAIRNTR